MRRVKHSKMSSKELSQIRGGLGLTQDKMAKRLGMSLRMYRYYEVEDAPIPVGSSLEILSGNKVVLETTDQIEIDCSVADKVSATLSIMEIT